jgi:N6-L-threonylcarbamoyladenine synthase
LAEKGDALGVKFPVTRISNGKYDFSFSGIKTAVLRYVQAYFQQELALLKSTHKEEGFQDRLPQTVVNLLASFQHNVVETLLNITLKAAEIRRPRSVTVSGGVACNRHLRKRFHDEFLLNGLPVYFPSPILSTDNAAMIAAAGYPKLVAGIHADKDLNADVYLKLHQQFPLNEE